MSVEVKEGDFANSVYSVAKELEADWYAKNKIYHPKEMYDFIPVLRNDLHVANRMGQGAPKYADIALEGIISWAQKRGGKEASIAVSHAVSSLIIAKDSALELTSGLELRHLFDVSLQVAVTDYRGMQDRALSEVTYHKSSIEQKHFQKLAREYGEIVKSNKYLQSRLRQTISISPASQRK